MTAAAFQATYSDWRVVKGRKVVQVVFELPLELADQAYQVLGGMPIAATEIWCGIARINPGDKQSPRPDGASGSLGGAAGPTNKRKFSDMSPAQQAGMLCDDAAFRKFIDETICTPCNTTEQAAEIVRDHCNVRSRSELTVTNLYWANLVDDYRKWQRVPEFV